MTRNRARLAPPAPDDEPADSAWLAHRLALGVTVGNFLLELAALSQSARLTREHVRLHTDFGSLLWLAHADPEFDADMLELCRRIVDAVTSRDHLRARGLVNDYIRAGVVWLIKAKAGHGPASGTTLDRSNP